MKIKNLFEDREKLYLQSPSYGVKGALGTKRIFEKGGNEIWFKDDNGRWKLSKYKTLSDAEFGEKMRTGVIKISRELYGKKNES